MSFTSQLEFKGEIVSAELKMIKPHESYENFIELLATANYMLPSNNILTEQALALSLLMCPIIVIRNKKSQDRYLCIGGIRSLLLAKSSLAMETNLSVTLVDRPKHHQIELMISADVLLPPLLLSIRNPATIGKIHQKLHKDDIEALLIKGMHNKSSFAEQTGYAKNTIFPPKSHKLDDDGDAS